MLKYIFLAVLNGVFISVSRVLIGRLSMDVGPFKASLWSYVVGFLFVAIALASIGHFTVSNLSIVPLFAYFGGFFGALYVVINSYVFTKMGAIKTVLLVVSGQMISGILLDYHGRSLLSMLPQFLGVMIILLGIYLAKVSAARR